MRPARSAWIAALCIVAALASAIAAAPLAAAPLAVAAGQSPPALLLANLYRADLDLRDWWVSEKFDGVRGFWDGTQLLTRGGERIAAPGWFIAGWPAEPMDGELWAGRGRFEQASATVRRQTPDDAAWRKLRFMVFDLPAHGGPFDTRIPAIGQRIQALHQPWVQAVAQRKVAGHAELQALLRSTVASGGEGLMLHRGASLYQAGRSGDLLKLKDHLDAEARVLAVLPGRGKYEGAMGALLVEAVDGAGQRTGVRFKLGTGFTDAERRTPPALGALVTYRYRDRNASGVPRFASFLRVRTDLADPLPPIHIVCHTTAPMMILAVNAGSSSLKFALHACATAHEARPPAAAQLADAALGEYAESSAAAVSVDAMLNRQAESSADVDLADALLTGHVQGLEPGGTPRLRWQVGTQTGGHALDPEVADGAEVDTTSPFGLALAALRDLLDDHFADVALDGIAHRVVHGGARYTAATVVDDDVLAELEALTPLAPLHQPHALHAIRVFRSAFPDVPQIGCFDTAFHATLAQVEYSYPLPREMTARGIRRYGFHGLSYQYVLGRLRTLSAQRANGRVLMAHLGNGASLCATKNGESRATTMGLTPLDGLMMGTRSGAVDPGILLCLMQAGLSADQLQDLLWKQSGLLGVSGRSADMRSLQAEPDDAARLAVDMFCHRVARETAALTASVGGLDLLAFTGGIGEHSAAVRADVADRLAFLGIELDEARNRDASGASAVAIHAPASAVEVWVVPTDEGRVAAAEAARLVGVGG